MLDKWQKVRQRETLVKIHAKANEYQLQQHMNITS